MAYYAQEQWQNSSRQASWEHPPSRSGASSSTGARDDNPSFISQMEEVERAIENLSRSGKLTPGGMPFRPRDPAMMGGPPRPEFGTNSRHPSAEYDSTRSHSSSNVQGFYQNQRYGGGRKNDPDTIQQAQRRMAAQRERDLRNYHQEQQYNRGEQPTPPQTRPHDGHPSERHHELTVPPGKPERSISPNMSEDERRDLIARQHRALYGDDGHPNAQGFPQGHDPRGPSPMGAYPPYGPDGPKSQPPGVNPNEAGQHGPSPQPHQGNTPPTQQNQQQGMRTSSTSPKDGGPNSPPRHAKSNSVAPIGTRPSAGSISQAAKRPTPQASSPLGIAGSGGDRAPSSASNPQGKDPSNSGWGSGSGVWGNVGKNSLGVQASVWG